MHTHYIRVWITEINLTCILFGLPSCGPVARTPTGFQTILYHR